ncbi:hypothetical protein WICPIJ_008485, partial [Wickerhamomyces pijperi]
ASTSASFNGSTSVSNSTALASSASAPALNSASSTASASSSSATTTSATAKLLKQKKRISSGSTITLSLTDPTTNKISLTTPSERRSTRIKGRQMKITANLLLLAGQHLQSLNKFLESWKFLNVSSDHLWMGSCLEGIAVCLSILKCNSLECNFQTSSLLTTIIGSKGKKLLSAGSSPLATPRNSMMGNITGSDSHGGAATVDSTRLNSEQIWLAYSLTDLVTILLGKAINLYELSRGDGEDCAPSMVYCDSILRYMKFHTVNLITRGGLTARDNDVVCAFVRGQPITEKLYNYSQSQLAYWSKEEIYKLGKKISQIRIKDLDMTSQCKIHSCLASIFGDLGYDRKRAFSLRQLLISVIAEINSDASSLILTSDPVQLLAFLNSILSTYGLDRSPETANSDLYSHSRWPQIHKSLILLCINLCEKLQCQQELVYLKSLLLTRYLDTLTDNEQCLLLADLKRINSEYDVNVFHFDPFVVRSVTVVPPSNGPMKQQQQQKPAGKTEKSDSPFIYNPFDKKKDSRDVYLVQDEYVEFQISVQNPFAFVLEITGIELLGFEVLKSHFSVPAKTLATVSIMTKPLQPGQREVEEIKIKTFNFSTCGFPIVKSLRREIMNKCKKLLTVSTDTVWNQYQQNMSTANISQIAQTSKVRLQIIPSQPSLQITKPSSQLLLLEGQTMSTSITLRNSSRVPINHIQFHINDSTVPTLQEILVQDKELPHSEIYEIEYFIHKKAIAVKNPVTEIKPGEEITLDLQVIGKRGMEFAMLAIDYGYKSAQMKDTFARRLEHRVVAIVNPSLELAGCDVIELDNCDSIDPKKGELWRYSQQQTEQNKSLRWVLFSLDLRNTWNKFLTVKLSYDSYCVTDVIVPLETKRFIIPIPKFLLSTPIDRIPSLSNKQYIASKLTKAEDQFLRESFWYRERILSKLTGQWFFDGSEGAAGSIEFRGIRLSQKMLSMIKTERVSLAIELKDVPYSKTGALYIINTEETFTVCVTVKNNSDTVISGILRNVPSVSTTAALEKRLLYNGALQHIITDGVQPGQEYVFQISAIVLEKGEYEWGALLDLNEVVAGESVVGLKWPLRLRAM